MAKASYELLLSYFLGKKNVYWGDGPWENSKNLGSLITFASL
jgi:hypothetical protein